MPYVPTDWVDDITPVDAAHMDHIEQGIVDAHSALDTKQATSQKGQANGYAGLDADGKVPVAQLPPSQETILMQALGFLGWPTPIGLITSGQISGSQNLQGRAVVLPGGVTITNIVVPVSTAAAGTAPTLIRLGIYDPTTGALLASTANLATDPLWTSVGLKQCPLQSPVTLATTKAYYICILQNGAFATTALQIGRQLTAGGDIFGDAALGAGIRDRVIQGGRTDLPDPATFANGLNGFWFGAN